MERRENGRKVITIPPAFVTIALPTHENVPAGFMYDLAQMMGYTGLAIASADIDMHLAMIKGTYIHTARQELAEAALKHQTSHTLWLDSDMRFPKDLLLRLLQHNLPIVGINYSTRSVPASFVALKRVSVDHEDGGERLVTGPDSTGLEEVEALGFGAVLIQNAVVDAMGEPPWFWYEWLGRGSQVGEDVYFCRKARAAGFPIYVDHDMSKQCAHVGSFEYRLEHAQACVEEALI